jgi:2-polyprenyl-6-methoxyphenol hydroxylase-like FAD-dependent oxidoreductase
MLGGSLDIKKGTGQRALAQAGLLETFYAMARPCSNRMADKHGTVRFEEIPGGDNLYDAPEIDRPDFRNLLLDSLAPGTVVWDRQVLAIAKSGVQFELQFQTGATALADVVIIADGTMSRARKYVTTQLPHYTGTYVIEGEVFRPAEDAPGLNTLANGGNVAVIEDKKAFFLHTKGNGHLSYYVSFRPSASWLTSPPLDFQDTTAVAAFLREMLAGWDEKFHELLSATNEYRGFPLRAFVLDEPWEARGNVTIIGDAAHAMPPFGGQGANTGLTDALLLVEKLTDGQHPTIEAAIAAYEQQMFNEVKPVQQDTLAADERIHTQSETVEERAARLAKLFASRA